MRFSVKEDQDPRIVFKQAKLFRVHSNDTQNFGQSALEIVIITHVNRVKHYSFKRTFMAGKYHI